MGKSAKLRWIILYLPRISGDVLSLQSLFENRHIIFRQYLTCRNEPYRPPKQFSGFGTREIHPLCPTVEKMLFHAPKQLSPITFPTVFRLDVKLHDITVFRFNKPSVTLVVHLAIKKPYRLGIDISEFQKTCRAALAYQYSSASI